MRDLMIGLLVYDTMDCCGIRFCLFRGLRIEKFVNQHSGR